MKPIMHHVMGRYMPIIFNHGKTFHIFNVRSFDPVAKLFPSELKSNPKIGPLWAFRIILILPVDMVKIPSFL